MEINQDHFRIAIENFEKISDLQANERLDQLLIKQPAIFSAIHNLEKYGPFKEEIPLLLEMLLIIFEALKVANIEIPTITEEEYQSQINQTLELVLSNSDKNDKDIEQSTVEFFSKISNNLIFLFANHDMIECGFLNFESENSEQLYMTGLNIAVCIALAADNAVQQK